MKGNRFLPPDRIESGLLARQVNGPSLRCKMNELLLVYNYFNISQSDSKI